MGGSLSQGKRLSGNRLCQWEPPAQEGACPLGRSAQSSGQAVPSLSFTRDLTFRLDPNSERPDSSAARECTHAYNTCTQTRVQHANDGHLPPVPGTWQELVCRSFPAAPPLPSDHWPCRKQARMLLRLGMASGCQPLHVTPHPLPCAQACRSYQNTPLALTK